MFRHTDIFVFEEIVGLLSAECFVALDAILKMLMGNNLAWGGKLLLCSGDCKQLPPISGTMIWASVNMCTKMFVLVLKEYVRAKNADLRLLNDMCKQLLTPDKCQATSALIMEKSHFEKD